MKKIFKNKNYYEILEIKQEATKEEIKKAFFILAKKYHPDINKEPDAAENFKIILEAYHILYNDNTRIKYNEFLKDNNGNVNNEYFSEDYEFDPTWIDNSIFAEDIKKEFRNKLSNLSQENILLSLEYFWLSFWANTFITVECINRKILSVIFKEFKSKISDNTIDDAIDEAIYVLGKKSFDQNNNDYKNIMDTISEFLDDPNITIDEKHNFIIKTISEDNVWDSEWIYMFSLWNYEETYHFFKILEENAMSTDVLNWHNKFVKRQNLKYLSKKIFYYIGCCGIVGIIVVIIVNYVLI